MAKRLTVKERKLVKGIVEGKTKTEAYIDAYDTKGHLPTVQAEASRTASKPHIKEAIELALQKQDLTIERIVQPLVDGLSATKSNHLGELTPTPDHSIRMTASDKLLGLLGAKGSGQQGNVPSLTFIAKQYITKDQ